MPSITFCASPRELIAPPVVAYVLLAAGFFVADVADDVELLVVVEVVAEAELSGEDFAGVDVLDDEVFAVLGDEGEELPAGGAAEGFFFREEVVEDWEEAAEEGLMLEETAAGETEAGWVVRFGGIVGMMC